MNRKQAQALARYGIYNLVEANREMLLRNLIECEDVETNLDRGRLRLALEDEMTLLYERATRFKDGNPR